MRVFVIGITGAIGRLLVDQLQLRGTQAGGLVRRNDQQSELGKRGIQAVVGDVATMSADELAATFTGSDVIVYTAGSNGGSRVVTRTVDGIAVETALEAARLAGVARFVLVSVLPESWRERDLGEEVEYYFAVKKQAEATVVRSALDWIILRPSLLLDDPGRGTISLSPAEIHHSVSRADVAATLVELLHEPRIRRQILELDRGETLIADAVANNVRAD